MKKLLFVLSIIMVGCYTSYRELYKTSSTNCELTDDGRFVYENDTLKITYYFWAENGVMNMRIYNKLNIPIFIDWKVSNFIDNNNNLQYWYDVSNSTSVSNSYWLPTNTVIPSSTKYGVIKTSTTRPDRIISIAPHSSIHNVTYSILPKGGYPPIPAWNYTFDASPVKFRNYLAFSMDESFTQKFFIDNQFYVSRIDTISESSFEGHFYKPVPVKVKYFLHKDSSIEYRDSNTFVNDPYKSPTSFYSPMIKTKIVYH